MCAVGYNCIKGVLKTVIYILNQEHVTKLELTVSTHTFFTRLMN